MQISIRETGMAAMRAHLAGVLAAGKALSGPIISLTSDKAYARFIETGRSSRPQVRRAGPVRMFELGIAAVRPQIGPALLKAIPGGASAVQAAKRSLNNAAMEQVRARTPVRSGALRASIRPSTRGQ